MRPSSCIITAQMADTLVLLGRQHAGTCTCIEVGRSLHDGSELEVLGELGLVEGLVEALGVHRAAQPQQPQLPLHLRMRHKLTFVT